ncbi:MAG: hypothetical protein HYR96_14130 [Deltaproteobacteria bacterium]|nr:hypothetical protein [Deltaproteobacteria bacterium]MBI3294110.1 hypothetical protein [Deltaproteobacteria bacterium]
MKSLFVLTVLVLGSVAAHAEYPYQSQMQPMYRPAPQAVTTTTVNVISLHSSGGCVTGSCGSSCGISNCGSACGGNVCARPVQYYPQPCMTGNCGGYYPPQYYGGFSCGHRHGHGYRCGHVGRCCGRYSRPYTGYVSGGFSPYGYGMNFGGAGPNGMWNVGFGSSPYGNYLNLGFATAH